MQLATYVPRDSAIHRVPAGGKLLALVGAAVGTVFLPGPVEAGLFIVAVLACYVVARIPWRTLWGQLRPLTPLVAALGIFQLAVDGWESMVRVVGTITGLVLLAALVSLTTRTTDLLDVAVRCCRPLRVLHVDPERIGLLLALAIRSVPVVVGLARGVREAQLARGLTTSPTAFAVPLVVRCLRHADRLSEALVARGAGD